MVNKLKHSIKHYKRPKIERSYSEYYVYFTEDSVFDSRYFNSLYNAECYLAFIRKNVDSSAFIAMVVHNYLKY